MGALIISETPYCVVEIVSVMGSYLVKKYIFIFGFAVAQLWILPPFNSLATFVVKK